MAPRPIRAGGVRAPSIAADLPRPKLYSMVPMQTRFRIPSAAGTRRALTLVEMIIAVFLVGVALFLITGWTGNLREQAKLDLAARLLADLDKAMARYFRIEGTYPHAAGPNAALNVTALLLDHEKTRPILEALPDTCWQRRTRQRLVDPWGVPLRYHGVRSDIPYVVANEGRPVFVSAGPDRDFGDNDPARKGDNLRSDDPSEEGFRLYNVLTEAPRAGGDSRAKKDN